MSAQIFTLSRDQVAALCPECCEEMRQQRISALKLQVVDPSAPDPAVEVEAVHEEGSSRAYAKFPEGLCKRMGDDPGFFTRCVELMKDKGLESVEGFCAALHKHCIGKWPSEAHKRGKHSLEAKLFAQGKSRAIRGVEIFKTGTHNGDTYTEQDLDDMVQAFEELDYVPALKIGHSKDESGAPAYGWVQNLRRVGSKLVADFVDVHDAVVDAIRRRQYDRVSSEIFFNLKRAVKDGAIRVYRRALKAVALLGAEVPAVPGLKPLHQVAFSSGEFECVKVFEQQLEVPVRSLLDALAERIRDIITFLEEKTMPDSEKLQEMEQKLAELNKQIEELKAASGKTPEELEKDEEYQKLVKQAAEISEMVKSLREKAEPRPDALKELQVELDAARAREEAMKTEIKALSERIHAIEQERRNSQIGERVRACKIPAFRPPLEALYSYALEHADQKVRVYSEKDGQRQVEERALVDVMDSLVSGINDQAERLFKALAYAGTTVRPDGTEEEAADREVARRVSLYRSKHPNVKTYEEALRAVLEEDKALRQRYEEQIGGSH